MKKRLILISFLILIILTACNKEEEVYDGKPLVYASFYPIEQLVKDVGGDTINVKSFMPSGVDPHFWEPTPRNMKELSDADILFVNGANMEKWVDQVSENLPNLEIITLSDSVELITYKGAAAIGDFQFMSKSNMRDDKSYKISFGHTHENLMRIAFIKVNGDSDKDLIARGKKVMEAKGKLTPQRTEIDVEDGMVYAIEMGHESGFVDYRLPEEGEWAFISDRVSEGILSYHLLDGDEDLEKEIVLEGSTSGLDKISYDPHSWLSIVNAKKYLNTINDKLIERYPKNERAYKRNKLRAVDGLTDLEFEYKDKFLEKRINEFVVTHNAYGYIARDFDLVQFPLTDLVSTEQPSLKAVRTAIDFCRTYDIDTIFYEYSNESKSAQSLADDIGGKTVPLISMEYISSTRELEDTSYEGIMRYNLESIFEAVK